MVAVEVATFRGNNSLMVLTWADKPLRAPGSLPADSKIPHPTVGHIEPGGYWTGVWDALPVWWAVCHDPGILGVLEHGIDPVFMATPSRFCFHSGRLVAADVAHWWHLERERRIQSGAIRQIAPHRVEHCVHCFMVLKPKPGIFHLVVDFCPFNVQCVVLPIEYNDLRQVWHLFCCRV